MHYYKFNISDWALHTGHLSVEEEAVYFRLVNHYYDTEAPIPKITQPVIRRLRLGAHADLVAIILEEFFSLIGDLWHHKRCDSEISAYQAKAETNQANGKKGGRPKGSKKESKPPKKPKTTQSVNSGNPDVTLTKNQEPLTKNQEPLEDTLEPDGSKDIALPKNERPELKDYYVAANYIWRVVQPKSNRQREPNFDKWANTIRLINTRDKREMPEIYTVMRWANEHQFWGANILCPDTLRDKFDKLYAQMTQENSNAENRPPGNPAQNGRKLTPAEQVSAAHAARYSGESAGESSTMDSLVAVQ